MEKQKNCEEAVYSEDYYDLIIDYNSIVKDFIPECVQKISNVFDIGYYPKANLPKLNIRDYRYSGIPSCYTLMDNSALEVSQILKLQQQPSLNLKGRGVLIGFVDTGIDYRNPLFCQSDGRTRIAAIWDQTERGGKAPEGFLYGSLYTEEVINQALLTSEPLEIVPEYDADGHGTYLAGIAAGGSDPDTDFIGAAPEAVIGVVKCKQAKQYLRDYYYIPRGVPCYQENDIMSGAAWLSQLADKLNMPLVLCIAMGSSMGPHDGSGPLQEYLGEYGLRRGRAVTVSAGNEANARHHYHGQGLKQDEEEDVEISVGEGVKGFSIEFWAQAPELYQAMLISPTGEIAPVSSSLTNGWNEYTFLFENTTITVEYGIVGVRSASQLIFVRMKNPLPGIWTLRITGKQVIQGEFHIWLPVKEFLEGEVFFLRSSPDITATDPAYTETSITLGAYRAAGMSLYPDSGRGFSILKRIKPDLAAPGADVQGPGLRNDYVIQSGTSAAAAVAAGACAQLMQWGIVDGNYMLLNSVEIRNILIRGASRIPGRTYPNREWGYGALDVYDALNRLRNL